MDFHDFEYFHYFGDAFDSGPGLVPGSQNERFWLPKTKFLDPDWYGLGTAPFLLDVTLTTFPSEFPAEVGETQKQNPSFLKSFCVFPLFW